MLRSAVTLRRAAGLGALILALSAAPPLARESSGDDDFAWSWNLRSGQTLDVRGINGTVHVTGATGRTARVVAEKRGGKRCDPSEVQIEVVEDEHGVMVCALYPRRDGKENVCGEEQSNMNCDVEVVFTVEVPAGVRFNGRTVNGNVQAEGLRGPAELSTVNGSISLETTSWGSATTVNGSIQAVLGADHWPEVVAFETVNGRIELELPREVSADVRGELTNGRFDTDFPLRVRRRHGMGHVRGTLGEGGSPLEVSTFNGDLVLRARS